MRPIRWFRVCSAPYLNQVSSVPYVSPAFLLLLLLLLLLVIILVISLRNLF